ncbi:hypothetical protein GCM10022235_77670 [Kribbella ginsengisoli]|uniref:Uncharacterized protein n=1 Tax=Kribbella ginsengisoli TaxID=363865 RepID=A0ABP6Z381_9ACTN
MQMQTTGRCLELVQPMDPDPPTVGRRRCLDLDGATTSDEIMTVSSRTGPCPMGARVQFEQSYEHRQFGEEPGLLLGTQQSAGRPKECSPVVHASVENLERIVRLFLNTSQDVRAQAGEYVVEVSTEAAQISKRASVLIVLQRPFPKYERGAVKTSTDEAIGGHRHQQMPATCVVHRSHQRTCSGRHRSFRDS